MGRGIVIRCFKAAYNVDTYNYRGITVLLIMEKTFEIIEYHKLSFTNEAYNKIDRYTVVFVSGSRQSSNLFIVQGLVQRS